MKLYVNTKSQLSTQSKKIIKLARELKIPVVNTNFIRFQNINVGKDVTQLPLILEISDFEYSSLETIEKNKGRLNIILLAYKVKDPRNLGAILRTSAAFGIKGVIITSKDSSPVNETVINASRNANILVHRTTNAFQTALNLKSKGYKIYCLDTKAKKNLNEINDNLNEINDNLNEINDNLNEIKNSQILLILGGEKGIEPKLKELSEGIRIPIENVESLNTSVALGICLYYFYLKNNFWQCRR